MSHGFSRPPATPVRLSDYNPVEDHVQTILVEPPGVVPPAVYQAGNPRKHEVCSAVPPMKMDADAPVLRPTASMASITRLEFPSYGETKVPVFPKKHEQEKVTPKL
jgi:hypothetical protein